MNIKYIIQLVMFFTMASVYAQQGAGGDPNGSSYVLKNYKSVDKQVFEKPDIDALRAEDKINDREANGPWRFGFNNDTSLDLFDNGTWFETPTGDRIWLIEIEAENAKTINLTFSNTLIPEGNELFVYNPDKSFILGKFKQKHIYKGELGTELVPGSKVIVEYFIPKENINNVGNIEISRVTHGYRTANEFNQRGLNDSGTCNMNVNCPDGANWVDQRNSAIMLVSGSNGFCSGALINNVLYDGTPYVLTANHCYTDPTNWVFRFQWQSDDCSNPTSSPSFESLSGATLRARRTPSDMCLVEITGGLDNGTVPELHTPFFAGWNNSNNPPSSTVSIHHPTGDIKKISFDDDPAIAATGMGSSEANSSWEVVWDRNTTTEGGSSGAPLFDQNRRIIGQLWGGGASCSNLNDPDWYGRVYNSWNPDGSANDEQLQHWLDPENSGAESIDGYDPYSDPLDYDVSISELKGANGIICGPAAYPVVTIRNNGFETLTSAKITCNYNNGSDQVINWTGSLSTYQSEDVNLSYFGADNGFNTIEVEVSEPNGQTDEEPINNSADDDFIAVIEGEKIHMDLTLDCFADETSWYVEDEDGFVWYSGGGYENPGNTTELVKEKFCLLEGCYDLVIEDSHGDGLNGSNFNGCDYDGSMILTRSNGEFLDEITEENSDFGSSITIPFCANNTVSKKELNEKCDIIIYPNPSNGEFTVVTGFEESQYIVLQDVTGKIIANKSTDKNKLIFNETHLSAGVYIIKVVAGSEMATKRIVIK
ncbi:MAG: T9SS type A sorting domain-containing protein [Brumimicrobium sp.]